jgi:outer membrane protein TolC
MKDLGAATQADVLKAEVDDSNNQLTRLRTERDREVAKVSLASYLGLDPREPIELAAEEPTLEEGLELDAATERALTANPALASARAGLSASRAAVRAAKAGRLPSLSLWGSTDYFNFELEDFDDEHIEWRYGMSLDFTIFDGFLTKSSIRRSEADLLKARRAAESAERDVILAVRQAWLDLEIARRSIDVAEGAARSSEEDLRLAQERYRLGEGTILDVIDAQVNLTRSRTDLVSARYDARIALSRLRAAVGDLAVPEAAE